MKGETYLEEAEWNGVWDLGEQGTAYKSLRDRTEDFALEIIRAYTHLSQGEVAKVIGRQFLRSGTSVGAHYREASRARSLAEFVSKMGSGLQELDETDYWLSLASKTNQLPIQVLHPVIRETGELIAIFTTCVKNAKKRRQE